MSRDGKSPTEPRIRADFTFGGEGPTLQLMDTSRGLIRTWFWDFGDGGVSFDRSPTHIYFADDLPRTYTVSLEVCGGTGPEPDDCDRVSKNIRVLEVGAPFTP